MARRTSFASGVYRGRTVRCRTYNAARSVRSSGCSSSNSPAAMRKGGHHESAFNCVIGDCGSAGGLRRRSAAAGRHRHRGQNHIRRGAAIGRRTDHGVPRSMQCVARARLLLRPAFAQEATMKRIVTAIFILLATGAPVIAAETTERNDSVPDANPECMQVNGPDCVLRSDVMTPRAVAPPLTAIPPAPPVPPVIIAPPGTVSPSAMRPSSGVTGSPETVISPSGTVITPGGTSASSGGSQSGGISTPGTATTGAGSVRR